MLVIFRTKYTREQGIMKILIVDDSRFMRKIVIRSLHQAEPPFNNLEIIEAVDGFEGLEQIKKHSPQLILSDNEMPNMTGEEMLQELQNQQNTIPILILSGSNKAHFQETMLALGAKAVLPKPFQAEDLIKLIHSTMQ